LPYTAYPAACDPSHPVNFWLITDAANIYSLYSRSLHRFLIMNEEKIQSSLPNGSSPREAAYLALLASLKEERFIEASLDMWRQTANPSNLDFHFAQQIAYGSAQMALALDFFAAQLADKKKLSLKLKERALLRTALYQYFFLQRVPLYAIGNETIKLARKYCHSTFTGFLNAIVRKLPEISPNLPSGDNLNDLSIHYSYPPFFVQELLKKYDLSLAKEIMQAGNTPAPTMVRIRPGSFANTHNLQTVIEEPVHVSIVNDSNELPKIAESSDYYIQNVTPAFLIGKLSQKISDPKRILDLCASPGGKLVCVHDFFPKSILFGNDVSPEKLRLLAENCTKYGLSANLSCSKGEEFPKTEKFDLIILDVPCSNSGVLNKRPEARWRLSKENVDAQEIMQLKLIEHAAELLAPQGEIWYMTCSILPQENEWLIKKAAQSCSLQICDMYNILPNAKGWDGGFACALKLKE
jgi:16S rRNA (cytosine967-C5)-methyltransferase